jgi:RNA polymerase sigma-70 factor (ECF subfamily)
LALATCPWPAPSTGWPWSAPSAHLPAGYRLVFVLHDIEGYEHHEIASMLDCSVGNSKSQLHKARLTLREALHSLPRQEARP